MQIYHTPETDEYYFKEGCYILELLNTQDDPALSIARAKVNAGITTRLHCLKNTVERYVIQQGCAEVEVAGKRKAVQAGDIVLIPTGERQRIRNTGTTDLVFLALCTPRFTASNYIDLEDSAEP